MILLQSELLDKSPEISSACYQVEGLRQSSRGRLHLYYLKYNYTVQPGDITLVAQLSIDRLGVSFFLYKLPFLACNLVCL